MNKIEKVEIEEFWGDKKVRLHFRDDVNFLIGVNGSGKTTIINLIAASLKADFTTLDRIQFKKLRITLSPRISDSKTLQTAFIEVEKTPKESTPFNNIIYKVKSYNESKHREYLLNEYEEEKHYRYLTHEYLIHLKSSIGSRFENNIKSVLQDLVDVSWLSIHRTSSIVKKSEQRSYESTIDLKIEELQIELVKYFSQLNRRYAIETESFQKYIFESLIEPHDESHSINNLVNKIDAEKEKKLIKGNFSSF